MPGRDACAFVGSTVVVDVVDAFSSPSDAGASIGSSSSFSAS